ncbi:MAG: M48 family metallopeptidase [Thermoanaerobaculia bacterium]|nr:M48 family metallopeptidase [Thermoanaerobaculia bacterium]
MTSGVAGIVLVGYMLRSMVPRRRGAHGGIVLAYAAAPALHDLVQEIAKAIGAPRPREIRVDLQANASAALRRGAWSLFRRDLVLTVGLPLAAGLDSRQLAGRLSQVGALELGHFASRSGWA